MFKVKAMERAERWHWHTDCVLLHCQVGWFQNWRRLWKSFSLLKNRKDLWSSCPHKVLRGCDSLISKTNHLEVESRASKILSLSMRQADNAVEFLITPTVLSKTSRQRNTVRSGIIYGLLKQDNCLTIYLRTTDMQQCLGWNPWNFS